MKTSAILAAIALALFLAVLAGGCTYHEHYYMGQPVSKSYGN